jgi:hypothetical protein
MYDGIPSDPKETADINSVISNSLALLVTAKILSGRAALRAAYDAGIVNPLPGMSIDDSILVIGKETQDSNPIQGTVF